MIDITNNGQFEDSPIYIVYIAEKHDRLNGFYPLAAAFYGRSVTNEQEAISKYKLWSKEKIEYFITLKIQKDTLVSSLVDKLREWLKDIPVKIAAGYDTKDCLESMVECDQHAIIDFRLKGYVT